MLRGLAGYEGLLIYGLTRVTRGPVAGIYTELAQAATRFPKVISRQTIPRLAHTTDTVPASNIHLGARSRINSTPQRIYGDAGILYCRNTFWFRSKEAAWARDAELELGKGRESLAPAAWCRAEPQVLVGKCQGEMSSLFPPA